MTETLTIKHLLCPQKHDKVRQHEQAYSAYSSLYTSNHYGSCPAFPPTRCARKHTRDTNRPKVAREYLIPPLKPSRWRREGDQEEGRPTGLATNSPLTNLRAPNAAGYRSGENPGVWQLKVVSGCSIAGNNIAFQPLLLPGTAAIMYHVEFTLRHKSMT